VLAGSEADGRDWAEDELGAVALGDARLTSRLVALARSLARAPDTSLPQALPKWSELKAAYRFFDNAKAVPDHILFGHIEATRSRTRTVPIVLAVQDTTYLNWEHHPSTLGLGRLSDAGRGIICHSTLAVTPERLPLGLLAQRNWVHDDETFGSLPSHKKRQIEDKESIKWLDSIEALVAAREACPETTFVSVGDREADVFELFAMDRPAGVELLVRASWNRVVDSSHRYLWDTLQAADGLGTVEVCAPRRPGEQIRQCTLSLRSLPITLKPPQARKRFGTVSLWGVLATETSPPKGEKAIEWLLLTTLPTPSVDDAIERVHWYTCRWTIEVWHRVLKTGCRIESRQLETADRLAVALTLYSIIAWRILYATMLARTAPDVPCTVILSTEEWQALYCNVNRVSEPAATPPSLGEAVLWIAKLGGFLARKSDGEPGPQVLWRGFQHLPYITDMFLIMRQNE
jgi:hypothetical protein